LTYVFSFGGFKGKFRSIISLKVTFVNRNIKASGGELIISDVSNILAVVGGIEGVEGVEVVSERRLEGK
jgi:hypothetical protein